jgi:hypothetical protein
MLCVSEKHMLYAPCYDVQFADNISRLFFCIGLAYWSELRAVA